MQLTRRRVIALQGTLLVLVACGQEPPVDRQASGGRGGAETNGAGVGSGGAASETTAAVRFRYQSDWKDHLGACASISDYRIKFGASPVPVTASIDVTPEWLGEYVEVDGRLYEDDDVLHIFTCSKSPTSRHTLQLFGKFGVDLPLEPSRRYTVTLSGAAATFAEDP